MSIKIKKISFKIFFKNYFFFLLPIWASYIIFTSLAPSPIERVIASFPSFTDLTTAAFYFGVTLQQTTLLKISAFY
jgi:hypothetical protein